MSTRSDIFCDGAPPSARDEASEESFCETMRRNYRAVDPDSFLVVIRGVYNERVSILEWGKVSLENLDSLDFIKTSRTILISFLSRVKRRVARDSRSSRSDHSHKNANIKFRRKILHGHETYSLGASVTSKSRTIYEKGSRGRQK